MRILILVLAGALAMAAQDGSPLVAAAQNGDLAEVQRLLKSDAEVNAATANGTTPLMAAAAAGNTDVLRTLLEHGAQINARESARGETALMFAAAKNRAQSVKLLLERGADPAITTKVVKLERPRVDEDGNPLPAASAGGGARANRGPALGGQARGASATVMGGMTALLLASRDGHLASVKALLDGGAPVNQVSAGDQSSPLIIAICNGHYDLARFLIDRGADIRLATVDGLTALYAVEDTEFAQVGWAPNPITTQEKTSYLDLLTLLLDRGADVNARLTKTLWFRPTHHNQEWIDKKGATTFWRAAQSSDVAAMKLLKAHGADPAIPTEEGVTALMAAAGLGWGANASRNVPGAWIDAVRYCLELGLDVNAHDIYNYTALHGAAYRGDNEMVQLLVERGARLDVRSKRGQTVTDMANGPMVNAHLPMEHPDTIALLEKLGAPPPEVPVAGAPKETQK